MRLKCSSTFLECSTWRWRWSASGTHRCENVPQMCLKCASNVPQMCLRCASNVPQRSLNVQHGAGGGRPQAHTAVKMCLKCASNSSQMCLRCALNVPQMAVVRLGHTQVMPRNLSQMCLKCASNVPSTFLECSSRCCEGTRRSGDAFYKGEPFFFRLFIHIEGLCLVRKRGIFL
jgi:hypothetical protein